VSANQSLVDDLADVLARTVVGWEKIIGHDLAQAPEVQRVLARYRAEKETNEVVQVWAEPDWHPDYGYRKPSAESDD
jgi:hypothetical protein